MLWGSVEWLREIDAFRFRGVNTQQHSNTHRWRCLRLTSSAISKCQRLPHNMAAKQNDGDEIKEEMP